MVHSTKVLASFSPALLTLANGQGGQTRGQRLHKPLGRHTCCLALYELGRNLALLPA